MFKSTLLPIVVGSVKVSKLMQFWKAFAIVVQAVNPLGKVIKLIVEQFKKVDDFHEFMEICRKARDIWGNTFSYTLIESKDFA